MTELFAISPNWKLPECSPTVERVGNAGCRIKVKAEGAYAVHTNQAD